MLKAKLERKELGLNIGPDGSAQALFWAPWAERAGVRVIGRGDYPLQKQDYGYWQGNIPNLKPGDRYLMVTDDHNSCADPASMSQPEGVHGPSAVADPNWFRDRENRWRGVPLDALIIYELHVGTFSPTGDFSGVEKRLEYLCDLGVTAIELMPAASFPGPRNWGYDGVFPFAVQASYGGAEGLIKLIDACHEHGLAVILDVVYNHLGPEGNYLAGTGPYFTCKYKTPWGDGVNFDDAWSDGVRRFFLENALMWLRDFNFDGLRLDAVHAITDLGPRHFLAELADMVEKLNKQTGRNHFLIGECDLNDVKYITPRKLGGYGLDAQWSDEFHHALHAVITGERQGYYQDFGTLSHLVRGMNQGYVYCRDYSNHRKKLFGTDTSGQPGERFVVFSQNHDQIGNRMLGERLSILVDFPTLKLAAGTVFISPYIPLLFMGEEYGEQSPFHYFISHGDRQLIEAVREGRKNEFRGFFSDRDPPDAQDPETFRRSRLKWDFQADQRKACLLAYYKRLIELKKQHPALRPGNRQGAGASLSECGRAMVLKIARNGRSLAAIMNFSTRPAAIPWPRERSGDSLVLLYSEHTPWGGPEPEQKSLPRSEGAIRINPRSIIVWEQI